VKQYARRIASFGAYALTNQFAYEEAGTPFLRCQDINNGFVNFDDVLFVDAKAHQLLVKSAVESGMVLLTMSGTVGETAVALPSWQYPVNSNQDIAKITPVDDLSPFYLRSFFASPTGQLQIRRLPVGSVQQHVFLWMIESVLVPRFSADFESHVARICERGYALSEAAERKVEHAGRKLQDALAIQTITELDTPIGYTAALSQVLGANRMDADYFSPAVTTLLRYLHSDGLTIGDVAPLRTERFVPTYGEFTYIEIGDVRRDGSLGSRQIPQTEAPSRATWIVRQGDVLASTVRPNRPLSAIVSAREDGAVCSSGFVVLRPTRTTSQMLFLYLRLPAIRRLMDLHTSASMYPAISERDLLGIPFKRVVHEVEESITAAIMAAQEMRRDAVAQLKYAADVVECAIWHGESKALRLADQE
jgi:type I restriction enzyme M protein